ARRRWRKIWRTGWPASQSEPDALPCPSGCCAGGGVIQVSFGPVRWACSSPSRCWPAAWVGCWATEEPGSARPRVRCGRRWRVRGDHFDLAGSDPQYARAFREYGIDVERLGREEAEALVENSAIRASLVAGLDDWANGLVRDDKEEGKQKATSLLAVSRLADA